MKNPPAISSRAKNLQASPLRKLAAAAETRKKTGVKVYHLNIGQPDLPTHPDVMTAVRKFNEPTIAYAPSNGLAPALQAWSSYYKKLQIDLKPEDIVITTGGSEGIIFALEAVCDANDEVIVFEPFYTNYNSFASLAGVTLKPVTLDIKDGFHLPSERDIVKAISKKTKAILICNPSNPTGTIFSKAELARLVKIARRYNLFILSDEVYREFAFENKHYSIMDFPAIRQQAVVLDSASKRFNVCGARIGIVGSKNKDVIASVLKMGMARLSVATIEQLALIPLLTNPKKYTSPITKEFKKRRDIVYTGLKKIPNITFSKPEGAFYIIIGLPIDDADRFASWMINQFHNNKETVLLAPAAGFYATPGKGKREVRLAYMLKEKDLKRSLELLRLALAEYNS
ncbi:MAG: pyridoxal phosphate-dependent aminotransferase [Candidatus Kerfeldbacteria bacterium]|nr:pyridoxal phosphate-dependent aminotransferase [Candidatus Kerfeldbacteria bacterium]